MKNKERYDHQMLFNNFDEIPQIPFDGNEKFYELPAVGVFFGDDRAAGSFFGNQIVNIIISIDKASYRLL